MVEQCRQTQIAQDISVAVDAQARNDDAGFIGASFHSFPSVGRSADRQRKIRETCMASEWKGRDVWMRSYPNDGEASRLIVELKAALEPCLTAEDRTGQPLGDGTVIGIRIDPGPDRRFSEFLVDVLSQKDKGNLLVDLLTPFAGGETTEIMVGLKPAALAEAVATITKQRSLDMARIAARKLDAQQQKSIASRASRFAGEHADITWYADSAEAGHLAMDIESALGGKAAG